MDLHRPANILCNAALHHKRFFSSNAQLEHEVKAGPGISVELLSEGSVCAYRKWHRNQDNNAVAADQAYIIRDTANCVNKMYPNMRSISGLEFIL